MLMALQMGSGAVALLSGSFLGLIAFPAGLPLEQMPADKFQALALCILAPILVGGSATA